MNTYRKSLSASLLMFLVSLTYGWASYSMIDAMVGPFSWHVFCFVMFGVAVAPSACIAGIFLLMIGLSQRETEKGPLSREIGDRIYDILHPMFRWLDKDSK